MSLVSLMAAKLSSVATASNAEFSWQQSANQLLTGIRQAGSGKIGFGGLLAAHNNENNLQSKMIMADVTRQASISQQDSLNKMLKENIKRSFDMYA